MPRKGFSLLEVIIATGILAASAVMLMSMFSTGDRHAVRADERTMAQMLCQSKMDELIANPSTIVPVPTEVIRQYPGWVWSLKLEVTSVKHFVKMTVSVNRIPGMETGADLEVATREPSEAYQNDAIDVAALGVNLQDPTYQLTRWFKFEGDVSAFETPSYSAGEL